MIIPPTIAGVKVVPLPVTVVPVCHAVPVEFDNRVNIHVAASVVELGVGPPTAKVFPSAEKETEEPCPSAPLPPDPTKGAPCCVHVPLA